jgi:hypothetical protein
MCAHFFICLACWFSVFFLEAPLNNEEMLIRFHKSVRKGVTAFTIFIYFQYGSGRILWL